MTTPFLLGEPAVYKRAWTTAKGATKSSYVVRWRIGLRDRRGRSVTREKRGFRTKEAARRYFYSHVLPALDDGHASPNEQHDAELREEAARNAARKKVAAFFTPLIENKPVHVGRKSFSNYKAAYRLAIRMLGTETFLDQVNFENIERILAAPTPQNRPPSSGTVRKRFFTLRSAFDRALDLGYVTINPCARIKIPKAGKGRLRYLTPQECRKLLEACRNHVPRRTDEPDGSWLYTFVLSAIYTGARLDELHHLEWTDVSWKTNQVFIQNKPGMNWQTKNGKSRPLGVNSVLLDGLREFRQHREDQHAQAEKDLADLIAWSQATRAEKKNLPRPAALGRYENPPGVKKLIECARGVAKSFELQQSSTLIFPNPWGEPRTDVPDAYWEIIETLGYHKTGACFHTLRHTYASHLAMAGVDMPTLKELMGHQSIVTTMQYAHLAPDHTSMKGALMPNMLPLPSTGEPE